MKHKNQEFELAEMTADDFIGAGSVHPFPVTTDETFPVLIPKGLSRDMVGLLIVSGPSLEKAGVFDGDVLTFRRDFTKKDIGPEKICAVYLESTGEAIAKKVLFGQDGRIVLRSSGGGFPDKYYDPSEIRIQGICYGLVRLTDRFGRFPTPHDPNDPF